MEMKFVVPLSSFSSETNCKVFKVSDKFRHRRWLEA